MNIDERNARIFNSNKNERAMAEVFQVQWSRGKSVDDAMLNKEKAEVVIESILRELSLQFPNTKLSLSTDEIGNVKLKMEL